ncbi:MAG: type II toxin-antitoxin system VapC family toxin [Candidatus Fibromonas sp.]|jgi:PIN domain nuclease of toxin-antitoxin system|nr:type II toxin-antitoxin system VapC family toxin [Candidatus Fibromonas sp.]
MNLLVDTQSFIWFCSESGALPTKIRNIMNDKKNNLKISVASLWEITIKMSLSKLVLAWEIDEIIKKTYNEGFEILHIDTQSLLVLRNLKFIHKDPFDRMIISQSISRNIPVISSDKIFKDYNVNLIWE